MMLMEKGGIGKVHERSLDDVEVDLEGNSGYLYVFSICKARFFHSFSDMT